MVLEGVLACIPFCAASLVYCSSSCCKVGCPWGQRKMNIQVPRKFDHWQVSKFYTANIRFLCQGMIVGEVQT